MFIDSDTQAGAIELNVSDGANMKITGQTDLRDGLLRNDTADCGNWLRVSLKGVKSNRFGVDAQVRVIAGDLTMADEVHSGRGYQSHYGLKLHFGLGKRAKIDRIEVKWIGGRTDVYRNVEVNQELCLVEGGTGSI